MSTETTLFELDDFALTVNDLMGLASIGRKIEAMRVTCIQVTKEINEMPWRLTYGYDASGEFGLMKAVIEEGP